MSTAPLSTPFTIGVTPLNLATWLDPDHRLHADLAQKRALLATSRDTVLRDSGETQAAQTELHDLILAHLLTHYPHLYARAGSRVTLVGEAALDLQDHPPLEAAARLIQEDLCLMRRKPDGWHLVAACLCFPSSWSLAEKIGRSMAEIHQPVPGFAGRMQDVVARMFDALRVETPFLRYNWSLYGDDRLHHPETQADPNRFPPEKPILETAHLRVERQTLRKLPESGDILFTIRIYTDPLASLVQRRDGAARAAEMAAHLAALTPAQRAYKGLSDTCDRFLAALAQIAKTGTAPGSGALDQAQ